MSKDRPDLLVLAIDLGSSSTRSAIFDSRARRLPRTDAAKQYSIRYTADGGAELPPINLRRAVEQCVAMSLKAQHQAPRANKGRVIAVGISSFWHGLLGVDRQWRPVTPIYTWADSRAAEAARRLRETLPEREVHARTGCRLHSSFWPAKLTWLRQTRPDLFRRTALWVSPVDWILHDMFGTTESSASMASATGLYDSRRATWDDKVCRACHVDPSRLPALRWHVDAPAKRFSGFSPRIFTPIGDGAAGNVGSGADGRGVIAINVGTSAAVRMVQPDRGRGAAKIPFGLFRYVMDADRCVIGGAVSNAGNLRQWALRELQLDEGARQNRFTFARAAAANDQLVVLPFWAGERAPTWPDQQLGVIDGLNQATQSVDILRALNSAVYYRLAQILELITGMGAAPKRIIVSGGILHSRPAVRLLADAIGHDVEVAREPEASLRGAAVYALRQLDVSVPSPPAGKLFKYDREFAARHRERRARQIELEKTLQGRIPAASL
jgi:gluconokinase